MKKLNFNWLDKTIIEFEVPTFKRKKKEKEEPIQEAIKEVVDKMKYSDDKDDTKAYAEAIKTLSDAEIQMKASEIKDKMTKSIKRSEKGERTAEHMFKIAEVLISGGFGLAGIILMCKAEQENFLPSKASNLVLDMVKPKKK